MGFKKICVLLTVHTPQRLLQLALTLKTTSWLSDLQFTTLSLSMHNTNYLSNNTGAVQSTLHQNKRVTAHHLKRNPYQITPSLRSLY